MHIKNTKNYRPLNRSHFYYNTFDHEKIMDFNKQQRERLDSELDEAFKKTEEAYQKLVDEIEKHANEGNVGCSQLLAELSKLRRRQERQYERKHHKPLFDSEGNVMWKVTVNEISEDDESTK